MNSFLLSVLSCRHHLDDIPEETVTRYMYNPRSGKWKTDEIVVKMQSQVHVGSLTHSFSKTCQNRLECVTIIWKR